MKHSEARLRVRVQPRNLGVPYVAVQDTHSPRLRIAVFAMALGCSTQSLKDMWDGSLSPRPVPQPCRGLQCQSQAGPSILSGTAVPVPRLCYKNEGEAEPKMLEMIIKTPKMNEYCTKKSTVGHVTQKYVAFPLISAIPSPQISVSPLLRLRTAVPDHEQSLPSARHCNPSPTAVPPSGGGLQSQSLHPGPGLDHSHSPGLGLCVSWRPTPPPPTARRG